MNSGALHIGINWFGDDKAGVTLVCGNCHQMIKGCTSENTFYIPVRVPRNCPKCGARFSKIVGRMQ